MNDVLVLVVALVLVAYLLLFLEVAVIPGFGVAGIAGLLSAGGATFLAFRSYGVAAGAMVVIATVIGATVIARLFSRSRFAKKLVHKETLAEAHSGEARVSVGDRGEAETDLRPSGIVRFGDERESVTTDGDYVERGAKVEVTLVDGNRVVVGPVARGYSNVGR